MSFIDNYKSINFSQKIAAIFCVYEDSGFLEEAVWRAYPFVDLLIISIGKKPWCGQIKDYKSPQDTFSKCSKFFDPCKKIEIHYRDFEDEASQRNWEKDYCHRAGYEWILIIDDDEFYNPKDLINLRKSINSTKDLCVLVPQRVYWKTRDYVINNVVLALPVGVRADKQYAWFNSARNVIVNGGGWYTHSSSNVVYHHLSYVRTDEQLLNKIKYFSHANDHDFEDWYKNFWLTWTPESTNFHPNPGARSSFEKAVPASFLPENEKLQPCGFYQGEDFNTFLKKTDLLRVPADIFNSFSQKGLQSFIYKTSTALGANSDQSKSATEDLKSEHFFEGGSLVISLSDEDEIIFDNKSLYIVKLTDALYSQICNEFFSFCLMPYFEQPVVVLQKRK